MQLKRRIAAATLALALALGGVVGASAHDAGHHDDPTEQAGGTWSFTGPGGSGGKGGGHTNGATWS